MATATFNGTVIAQSDDIEIVEGNTYFPVESLDKQYVHDSDHSTYCPWKGDASYWDVEVGGERAANAAWYYPTTKEGAEAVANRVAFYPAVTVDR
jgi:uncharacterized protein (DUF427 family)